MQPAEFDAFAQRWSGSYVEDRLRNDWLLELGRRRDWATFAAEYPRFRMNDDREVTCYALLTEQLAGQGRREAAGVAAWLAQKEADDGCAFLAADAGRREAAGRRRHLEEGAPAVEANRPRAARQAAVLLGPTRRRRASPRSFDGPARYLGEEGADRDPRRRRARRRSR